MQVFINLKKKPITIYEVVTHSNEELLFKKKKMETFISKYFHILFSSKSVLLFKRHCGRGA